MDESEEANNIMGSIYREVINKIISKNVASLPKKQFFINNMTTYNIQGSSSGWLLGFFLIKYKESILWRNFSFDVSKS